MHLCTICSKGKPPEKKNKAKKKKKKTEEGNKMHDE
jgi:hypothetical protein